MTTSDNNLGSFCGDPLIDGDQLGCGFFKRITKPLCRRRIAKIGTVAMPRLLSGDR